MRWVCWRGVGVGKVGWAGCAGWCRCLSYRGVRCTATDIVVAPTSAESRPNKEALFCVLLAQAAIGLTGVSPAVYGTTILSQTQFWISDAKLDHRNRRFQLICPSFYCIFSLLRRCYKKTTAQGDKTYQQKAQRKAHLILSWALVCSKKK